jgi:hypothetical protein
MNFGFSKPGDDPFAELLGESTGSSFPSSGAGFNIGNNSSQSANTFNS